MAAGWICVEPIELDHVRHMPGDPIALTDDQVKQLLELGHIRPADDTPQQPKQRTRKRSES